jgi:hypothetical protein
MPLALSAIKEVTKLYEDQDINLTRREAIWKAYQAYENVKFAEDILMDKYYDKIQKIPR